MPVIYFDNFRGFNKTYLPLSNVNFFVGENSSGKTSVLKLIKILSDQRFWFNQEFHSGEAELGYYSEIASYANKTKKYFEIGILSDFRDFEGISAAKIRFENKEGIPLVKELSIINDDINIQAIVDKSKVKYRHSLIEWKNLNEENKTVFFRNWIENNDLINKSFDHTEDSGFAGEFLFFQVQSFIAQIRTKGSKNKRKQNIGIQSFMQDIAWLAPIRTDPKRTYDSYKTIFNPDGAHAPYLLKKLLANDSKTKNKEYVESVLQKFGKDSGLFNKIIIKTLGKEDTSPFELQVLLNDQPLKITNVGYGVSQILPLIVEVIARHSNTWFAIQQPEIHLHPRGQAAFGDFLLKSATKEGKRFIVETHSDYTMDRFRLKLSQLDEKEIKNFNSQIVFFNRVNSVNELTCIPISNDGSLPDNQPKQFREFFIREQLDLLKM